jgi:hypothetical protein
MPPLPPSILAILAPFASLFCKSNILQETSAFWDFTSAISCYLAQSPTSNLEEANPQDPAMLATWQEEGDPIGHYK